MKQRDIIWVSVMYADFKDAKVRPAVIVSNNAYNESHDDVVVCALTTNMRVKDYSIGVECNNLCPNLLHESLSAFSIVSFAC